MRQVGDTTLVGYFTQYPPHVSPALRVIDYIREVADDRKARSAGLLADAQVDTPEVRPGPGGVHARARRALRVHRAMCACCIARCVRVFIARVRRVLSLQLVYMRSAYSS